MIAERMTAHANTLHVAVERVPPVLRSILGSLRFHAHNIANHLRFVNSHVTFLEMSKNEHVSGFVRVLPPRYKIDGQRRALEQAGVSRIYIEGTKGNATLNDVIRNLRPGDVVAVVHTFLLADPRMKRKLGGARADLWTKVDAIENPGASIWEVSSGLRSSDRKQREVMMREAIEALARGRHKTSNSDKRGRPPWEPTKDEYNGAKAIWDSRHVKGVKRAVAAIKKKISPKWSQSRLYDEFGPRNSENREVED